ncbi:MAG: hypothetical protein IK066_03505 [Kiritimatiellae bacterium]|nr:hypothetical protein [Kiritimatiellia bacterium]
MKLAPEGRKRLETMKKALAAGLPLAGLLAGAAMGASEALAGSVAESEEFMVASPRLHVTADGHLVAEDGTPVVVVREKTEGTEAPKIAEMVVPGYLSGGRPSGPAEGAAEGQP